MKAILLPNKMIRKKHHCVSTHSLLRSESAARSLLWMGDYLEEISINILH